MFARLSGRTRPPALAAFLLGVVSGNAFATRIVFDGLNASLDTGTLAGTRFPVSFSYDADQVSSTGDSFIPLLSVNFNLLGAAFDRSGIFQGGQVIFRNAQLSNVTASYQVFLPPNAPVNNITFGFGGPGVIGYIDLQNQFGRGSFTFVSAAVPEPNALPVVGLVSALITGISPGPTARMWLRARSRAAKVNRTNCSPHHE